MSTNTKRRRLLRSSAIIIVSPIYVLLHFLPMTSVVLRLRSKPVGVAVCQSFEKLTKYIASLSDQLFVASIDNGGMSQTNDSPCGYRGRLTTTIIYCYLFVVEVSDNLIQIISPLTSSLHQEFLPHPSVPCCLL